MPDFQVPQPVQAEFDAWLAAFGDAYEAELEQFVRRKRYEEYKWDEGQHPRHPPGSDKGGEFAPKEGGGSPFDDAEKGAAWRKKMQKRYDEDPEFRATVDALAYFTQGEYSTLREASMFSINGQTGEEHKARGLEKFLDEKMSGHPMASYKNYFKGQDLNKGSSATLAEGARGINNAIAKSGPQPEFHRGVYGREVVDGLKSLKPGATLDVVGASSFTSDRDIAEKFSLAVARGQGKGKGLGRGVPSAVVTVEAGAKGVPVSSLSPWKQKEIVSSGRFEVVSVDTIKRQVRRQGYWTEAEITHVRVRQTETWRNRE